MYNEPSYLKLYNSFRYHQSLDYGTPDEMYQTFHEAEELVTT